MRAGKESRDRPPLSHLLGNMMKLVVHHEMSYNLDSSACSSFPIVVSRSGGGGGGRLKRESSLCIGFYIYIFS